MRKRSTPILPILNWQGFVAATAWLAARHGGSPAPAEITDADRQEFPGFVFDRYYRITAEAIRKYDAHHLRLGSRLHKNALLAEPVLAAAGRHLDVVSFNFYPTIAPTAEMFATWRRAIGDRPIMFTEFYAKGSDLTFENGGAGWIVHTQTDRGRFYENFVLTALESRCVVSWQWFKHPGRLQQGSE